MAVNTTKIVKNTTLLYIRMLVTMGIGLFSVRIVLKALGVVDYGIFNVVGGIVTMLAFLNNALASTTQRFLSYEHGKDNIGKLKQIFSTSLSLYIILAVAILILAETVGLWFINSRFLVIPPERMTAANYIYQFSIFSFIFTVLSAPYNAAIIARENMKIYAYVSMAEAACKLAVVYILLYVMADKLIMYGFMLMVISFIIFLFYKIYSTRYFEECRYKYGVDKESLAAISGFAGWGVWGAMSNIFKSQGVNILLNMFAGPVANAARGITYQIDGAVTTFIQNFYTAVRPQMVKSYAGKEFGPMFGLLSLSTRIGYYLMLVISTVVLLEAPYILDLWLESVPDHTVSFTRLVLISSVFFTLAQPLVMIIHATGKVAKYQFIGGLINIMVLPLSYLFLKMGWEISIPYKIIIGASVAYWMFSIRQCVILAQMPLKFYFGVIARILLVTVVAVILPIVIYLHFPEGTMRLIYVTLSCLVSCGLTIYCLGISATERKIIDMKIEKVWRR